MDTVAPLRARLALPGRAAEVAESLVEGWDGQVPAIDPSAYAPVDEAAYVYRQRRGRTEHLGVVLEVQRDAVAAGRLRDHEAVFPRRVEALARHLATGHPRTSLISALHEPGPAYLALLAAVEDQPPALEVVTADGGEHALWRVTDEAFSAVAAELGAPTLYIADGHHRVAANRLLWDTEPAWAARGLPVVLYPFDGLRLEPFHRLLPGPVASGQLQLLQDRLRASYDVVEVGSAPALSTGQVAMYADGRWLLGTSLGVVAAGVAGLAAVRLEEAVLEPSGAPPTLPVRASLTELSHRCDTDGGVLFALPAPSLSTLIEIADSDEVMPAKATSFQPKPVSGLLVSE
jgi:uncharacterized protein (DUF1015 family)